MKLNKKQAGILLGAIAMMEFETSISLYTMELKLELLKFHGGEDALIRIWDTLCQIETEKRAIHDIQNPPAIMARRRELRLA